MIISQLRDHEVDLLAQLVYSLRARSGREPSWDLAGVKAALHRGADTEVARQLHAAIAAAGDASARTPAAMLLDRWLTVQPSTQPTGLPRCSTCGLVRARCQDVQARAGGTHPFTPRSAA